MGHISSGPSKIAGFLVALQGFRDIGMPFETAVTLLELGDWLAGQGRREEAGAGLAEAREVFERLKARPWLERLAQLEEMAPAMAAAPGV